MEVVNRLMENSELKLAGQVFRQGLIDCLTRILLFPLFSALDKLVELLNLYHGAQVLYS